MKEHYDAVVLAMGAYNDRKLGIEGEDLDGVYSFARLWAGTTDIRTTVILILGWTKMVWLLSDR